MALSEGGTIVFFVQTKGEPVSGITAEQISYTYDYGESVYPALSDISFAIEEGEFIAILGSNGSGKSTLARHLNAILELQKGGLQVFHMDAAGKENLYELRRLCGMVFQNPDNQFVSNLVEEDVAFGLQNYDTPEEEIPGKVRAALSLVGLSGFERRSPQSLSGGQKQRAAMAGVLAVEPEILVLDEATSMLDPEGRGQVLAYLKRLHQQGRTIVAITHYVEEAVDADRVFLMQGGRLLKAGTPREVLTDRELLARAKLIPPMAVQLYYDLLESGVPFQNCPLTNEELVEELCRLK